MKSYSFILFLVLSCLPFAAHSDGLDRWNTRGAEAKACTEATGGWCVTLTCGFDGNLTLVANGRGLGPGTGQLSVDRKILGRGQFSGSQNTSTITLNPNSNRQILSAMSSGSNLRIQVGNAAVAVTLKGSSKAISHVLTQCTRASPPPVVSSNRTDAYARMEDEQNVTFPQELGWSSFSRHRNTDVWGGDIRSGLTDPLLAGISRAQCARLCLTTRDCGAYTFNDKDGDVCFLKTGAAKMRYYQGATTGVRDLGHARLHAPATRGQLPVLDEQVAWRAGEPHDTHAQRARDAASWLGRGCEAERSDLQQLANDLNLSLDRTQVEAGGRLTLNWSGNSLIERIPVWVIVSSPESIRFDGSAAMVLGPTAPNPFGLATAKGTTRAMVSLWGRGAGTSGQIDITPLKARSTPIDVHVVGWLRQCHEEVVLSQHRHNIDVTPAQASLVIGTPASRADMTHAHDIPTLDRRIEFGEHRFRILSLSDRAEVIERDGRGLRLSPTGRFVLASGDVVDVLDGSTVATVISATHWLAGDSFVMGSTAPWGTVNLASTFGARMLVQNQITGPSCCPATPENTHLGVDLENGLLTLRGTQGFSIAPIQGQPYAFESAKDGYASDDGWSPAAQLETLYAMGPVSPVSVATGFNAPDVTPIGPELKEIATPLPRQGSDEDVVVASLFRGTGSAAVSAFERIGIDLMEGISTSQLLAARTQGQVERPKADILTALTRLRPEAKWTFDVLETPEGIVHASDCFHFLAPGGGSEASITEQTDFATPGSLAVPQSVAQLAFIDAGTSSMLLGRMECQAGATFGSLRGQSYFFALPMKRGAQPKLLVDHSVLDHSYLANATTVQFQDFPFEARLFGDRILAHNGRGGGMLLFEAQTGQVVHEWAGLTAGSLMIDAFMTKDQSHVVQMNSDGGFFVYRIEGGKRVLSGRIVEDEVAVWTDDFRFDATAEAATLIDLRFPGLDDQFSLDRFSAHLAVPGLSKSVLGGQIPPARSVPVPPDLSGKITLSGDQIIGTAQLTPSRQAHELRLYQGGVLTKVQPLEPQAQHAQIKAQRLPGARHASLLAVDENGLASNAVSADLGAEQPGGTRRALAVAVDLYKDDRLVDLNYAKADADRFMQTVAALPASVPGFDTPQFVGGRRAKPEHVLSAISDTLSGLGPADHAVLFFAGHGLQDDAGRFYLALSGTDMADLEGTAVAWSDVAALLASSKARITVLIDACHSGSATAGVQATNDGAVQALSSVPSNLTILAASKGRQLSIEARSQSGGLFTVALERVLLGERAAFDQNGNGRIEASELAGGVARIVSTQSEGRQVPWMTKGRVFGDYALF
ncbi:MAG: caspase family protein [Pelagimonas sp.]|nr:caspase family protein [Pelagimonas sp.]